MLGFKANEPSARREIHDSVLPEGVYFRPVTVFALGERRRPELFRPDRPRLPGTSAVAYKGLIQPSPFQ